MLKAFAGGPNRLSQTKGRAALAGAPSSTPAIFFLPSTVLRRFDECPLLVSSLRVGGKPFCAYRYGSWNILTATRPLLRPAIRIFVEFCLAASELFLRMRAQKSSSRRNVKTFVFGDPKI